MWKLFIACVSGAVWDLVGTVLIAILTAPPLRIQYGQGGPAELDHASLGLEPNGTRNDLNPLGGIDRFAVQPDRVTRPLGQNLNPVPLAWRVFRIHSFRHPGDVTGQRMLGDREKARLAGGNLPALQPEEVSRTAVLQLEFDGRWDRLHGPADARKDAAVARFAAGRPTVFHDKPKISHLRPFINESDRRALTDKKAILDAPDLLHFDLGIGQHISPAAQSLSVEQFDCGMAWGWSGAGRYGDEEQRAQAPYTAEFSVLICHSGAFWKTA